MEEEDYSTANAHVYHMHAHKIWIERFRKYKLEKIIEEPLVDRTSMTNFRGKDDKGP